MKKLCLLFAILFQMLNSNAQSPELIFGNSTNLSVIDFDPEMNVVQYGSGSTSKDFDLDTDGSADITINLERKLTAFYESAFITFPNTAAQIALNTADDLTIIAFKQGDSLYKNLYSYDFDEAAFDGALLYVSSGSNQYGQFANTTFRYLAFRITAGDTLYGWLRMARASEFNTDSLSYRIDQLAYEGTLSSILPTGALNGIKVNPTITNSSLVIENNELQDSKADLYSLSGKLLLHHNLTIHKNELHLDTFPDGMYLLVVTSAAGQETFKVIKQ